MIYLLLLFNLPVVVAFASFVVVAVVDLHLPFVEQPQPTVGPLDIWTRSDLIFLKKERETKCVRAGK